MGTVTVCGNTTELMILKSVAIDEDFLEPNLNQIDNLHKQLCYLHVCLKA